MGQRSSRFTLNTSRPIPTGSTSITSPILGLEGMSANITIDPAIDFDILLRSPVDVAVGMLEFLDARSVCRAALACRMWFRLANDSTLWQNLCIRHWADKQNGSSFVVKTEELARLETADTNDHPPTSDEKCPVLQLRPPVWKQQYKFAEKDAKRTDITFDEVTTIKWRMSFATGMDLYHFPEFRPDGQYRRLGIRYRWTLVKRRGETMVQVNEFPPARATRTSDWGWRMETMHANVAYTSIHPNASPEEQKAEIQARQIEQLYYDNYMRRHTDAGPPFPFGDMMPDQLHIVNMLAELGARIGVTFIHRDEPDADGDGSAGAGAGTAATGSRGNNASSSSRQR